MAKLPSKILDKNGTELDVIVMGNKLKPETLKYSVRQKGLPRGTAKIVDLTASDIDFTKPIPTTKKQIFKA